MSVQVFNVAGDETPTLAEYAAAVAAALGPGAPSGAGAAEQEDQQQACAGSVPPPRTDGEAPACMVSVCMGPVSNAHAREVLGWTPTPLAQAVRPSRGGDQRLCSRRGMARGSIDDRGEMGDAC
mmetsp:Transcript_12535/g.34469  ORF Transcript_12535/g.34469 Transcript_12535/m.34469 type:complete len:124 (+) Transcript_12535:755-1126(+)